MDTWSAGAIVVAAAVLVTACASPKPQEAAGEIDDVGGVVYTVRDTTLDAELEVSAIVEPLQRATLATKLLGSVVAVLVTEGDAVTAGQILARIDARDIAARQSQVSASITESEAVRRDALAQAGRLRTLFADSAATRAQLDAAETGLARAEAAVRVARASAEELAAMSSYAEVRAPFAGVVTRRHVDPGAFVAPGTPIVTVEDASRLRIRATAPPGVVRGIERGRRIPVSIERIPASGVIEGVVPAATGNLSTVNVLVSNRDRAFLVGSAASVTLSMGLRKSLLVPAAALRREGDLTGVVLRTDGGDEIRWVRVSASRGAFVEIAAGLHAGDRIVVPAPVVERGR